MHYMGCSIETTINGPEYLHEFEDAVFEAIRVTFEGPVLDTARAMSPLGTEALDDNSHLIHNRDSLKAKAFFTHEGPMGKLWTTSGHGWFIEVGTRYMGAQPYMWPALQSSVGSLMARIKENISVITVDGTMQAFELGRVLTDTSNEDLP